jgi:hypothetical protein
VRKLREKYKMLYEFSGGNLVDDLPPASNAKTCLAQLPMVWAPGFLVTAYLPRLA